MKKTNKKINQGIFSNQKYTKYVNFNKAVLWKYRELSLRSYILAGFVAWGTLEAVFIDREKGEKWIFDVEDIKNKGKFRVVGHEEQYYFPISIARKEKI